MGANTAGDLQKTYSGAVWRENSYFKTAHQHGGQRLSAGIPLQTVMLTWIAQLCLSSLTALSQKNYCETFQDHYWNKLNSSVNSIFTALMSPCLWKNNVFYLKNMLHATALPQRYRDNRVKVPSALGLAALLPVASFLIHACLLKRHRAHETLKLIQAWWRVRLKNSQQNHCSQMQNSNVDVSIAHECGHL